MIKLFLLINMFYLAKSDCNNTFVVNDPHLKFFYKFNTSSDTTLERDDDGFLLVDKKIQFNFFNKHYALFYISTNGVCQLVENSQTRFVLNSYPSELPVRNKTIIAPFWTDISTEYGGHIYYRLVTDSQTLNQISCDIVKSFNSFNQFNATWATLVTWYQVRPHISSPKIILNNTFQLALVTDNYYSFLIFNYGVLDWPNEVVNKLVMSGFNSADGKVVYQMRESFTHDIINLNKKSNVKLPSKWIFRIDYDEKNIKNFIKFGTYRANDSLIYKSSRSKFIGPIMVPKNRVKLSKITYLNSLHVYKNGLITLNKPYEENVFKPKKFPLKQSLISPFWTSTSFISNGDIYYREINDSESLDQIKKDINDTNYEPIWSFVVTYHQINLDSNDISFQVILTLDTDNLYVIFNYYNMNWKNQAQIGYNLEMRDLYYDLNETINDLCLKTNVNQPGKYVYKITTTESSNHKSNETENKNEYRNYIFGLLLMLAMLTAFITILIISIIRSCRNKNNFMVWYKSEENDKRNLIINEDNNYVNSTAL